MCVCVCVWKVTLKQGYIQSAKERERERVIKEGREEGGAACIITCT